MSGNQRARVSGRIVIGSGAVVMLLLGMSGIISASTVRPTQEEVDPQGSTDSTEWVGALAPGVGVLADDSTPKSEELGPIGSNDNHTPDVPGEIATTEADDLAATQPVTPTASDAAVAEMRAALEKSPTIRVNVVTVLPVALEASVSTNQVADQRAAIAGSLDALEASVAGRGATLVSRLESVPAATFEVTQAGLDALLADPNVAAVSLDGYAELMLDVSTGVIDSDLLNAAGVLGNNFEGSVGAYEVAILDSGVDNQHNAFAGRIVTQACFSAGSDCPNGATTQFGGNAADNCTYTPVTGHCEHGTHVAGIAAGASTTGGHEGVAREARIVAVQIGSDSAGSWSAAFSDINAALQHVLNLKNGGQRIVAVNMSIGIFGFAQNSNCDANNATFQTTQNLAANLQAAGVAVIAAAGNDNLVGASYPACLSSVFSISASDDADNVAAFTNSGVTTDWWAPGVGTVAPIPPGPETYGSKSGTSMAAPHVAGAWALMRECVDGNGVPITNGTVASRFNATGVDITDNGATRRRINVLDAATSLVNNNDFAFPETLPPGGNFNDFDFTVCSDTEPGEPGPFSLDNGIWYSFTPNATGAITISTEDGGGNVTTFDTTLAVYTGATLGTLQTVAFDDDSGTGLRSLVTLGVNAGTTYRIKVDGFAAQNGLLNLALSAITPIPCSGVNATLVGNAGNDTLNGTAGPDVIVGGAGNDTINGLGGDDRICGDAGNDLINGGAGNDFVLGGSGADNINGGNNNDTLVGNPGGGSDDDLGDTINGGSGDDFLDGWFGDDTLIGGPGNDHLRGEAGVDTVSYAASATAVNVNLNANTVTGEGNDTLVLVENAIGSNLNDTLTGNAGSNVLSGRNGNDIINAGDGNDTLSGGAGDDSLNGQGANDTVDYSTSPGAVIVNLNAGTATGEGVDTLGTIENATGSNFNDTLTGNGVGNTLLGRNGNDIIDGGGGNDTMNGGDGNDTLRGRGGNDAYVGGAGVDTATFVTSASGVTVNLATGTATGEGSDTTNSIENVTGSDFNDTLTGASGNNVLIARSGNDTINAGGGNDTMNGGPGTDTCNGGNGVDTASACETISGVP